MQAPTYWLLNNAWLKSFQPTDRFLRKMGACLGAHFLYSENPLPGSNAGGY